MYLLLRKQQLNLLDGGDIVAWINPPPPQKAELIDWGGFHILQACQLSQEVRMCKADLISLNDL